MRTTLLLVALLAWAPAARADDPPPDGDPGGHRPPKDSEHRASFRIGAATTDTTGKPTLCLEIRAVSKLSFEACGTGSDFLYDDKSDGREMAHFRAHWQLWGTDLGPTRMRIRGGAGFAELQLGDDEAGFQFGTTNGAKTSTAGPEASVSVQWLLGVAAGIELVATGSVGSGYFPGAPKLMEPQSQFQPFASVDIGFGF